MNKIKIITDSTADLPKEVYEKYDIEVLPLIIGFGEETYLDGIEINPKTVFEKIEKENVMPTTGQIIPNRFMETFKKYLDEGYKIISLHLSSCMSGTYQSACIAKNALESEDIVIIDSQNVTSALGILVLKTAKLVEKGCSLSEIEKEINEDRFKVESSIMFESLEYLARGGRISKTAGVVGGMLGIKVILEIKDGLMSVKDKIRGSKKAIKRIISDLESATLDEEVPVLLIDVENVEVKDALRTYLNDNNINYMECPVGSTVSIHSGPHCCGLVFLTK